MLRIACLLVFCCGLVLTGVVEGGIDAESEQKVMEAIESLKKVKVPKTGRGVAFVKMRENEGKFEKIIEFAFKDKYSRSAIYRSKDRQRGDLERGWALGPKGSCTYSQVGGDALIDSNKYKMFYRDRDDLRFDFHPETFLMLPAIDISYAEALERIVKNSTDLSVDLGDDSVMHITAEYESGDRLHQMKLVLNREKGFLPVHAESIEVNKKDASKNRNQSYDIKWAEYDGQYYVTSFINEYEYVTVSLDATKLRGLSPERMGEIAEAKRKAGDVIRKKVKLEVTIDKFLPGVEIDDREFSLESFGLPPGTEVYDKTAGRHYEIEAAN